jgi:hypothetical protein
MKPKIPAVRVDSDGCAINVGQVVTDGVITEEGTPHYVHKGEWVEILPIMTVREVMQISRLQNSAGDTTELGENLTALCRELSRRVIAWNWTDLMGDTMEQPYKHPEVLEGLSSEELMWLMSAANGSESADARKKGSKKSGNTSSEMAPNPKA